MFQTLLRVFLIVVFVAIETEPVQGQLQVKPGNAQQVKDYSDAARILAAKIPIELNNGKLELGLPDRDSAFVVCREIVGGHGGGGSSTSGNMWSCNSNSDKFRAEMGNSFENGAFFSADRLPGKSVYLDGLDTPFQKTFIRQSQDELLAFHIDTGNSRVFWMKASGKKVVLLNLDGPVAQAWEGESWDQLNGSHDLTALRDGLTDFGISLPKPAAWGPVASLIRDLIVFPESGWEEFINEFHDLNSTKFEDRDAASAKLAKETGNWQVAIAWGLLNSQTPPEVKARLRLAVAADPESPANHLIHTVTSGKLHQVPRTLIRVLETEPEPDTAKDDSSVFAQLRVVTGEKFGDELNVWKNWLALSTTETPERGVENDDRTNADAAEPSAGDDAEINLRSFDSAKVDLSNLLSITIDGQGRWVLDRESWRAHFGGREASELIDELTTGFRKSGLPKAWLDIGNGYDPTSIGFPQILFEKYTQSMFQEFSTPQEKQMAQIRQQQQQQQQLLRVTGQPNTKSLNRLYNADGLKVNLTLHPQQQANRGNLAEEFFDLEISEDGVPGRMIHFREEKDGSLKLFCMGPGQSKILGLGQNPEGECWIHLIEAGEVKTIQSDSAMALITGNRDWFGNAVKPMLAEMGIGLGVAAGGPLPIVNQRPIE